ncbi:MAG: hypothetical protein K8F92_02465 [Hyphomicrobium sp.]|uniref:hypothetical protein n=1 Tax=Hyphomicrobium sp. TaxID=82 RepID=UPI00132CA1E7|nr:hypothetical protein [Hyphomicrobium sp.]KAB2942535.1 MAG: hypothetical protein F9K20_05980 [Hyphomicrobium sp.]MBZ0208505.1 hypothetical protein [Hyphomicrobium sp.]
MASTKSIRTIAIVAALLFGRIDAAGAQELDALFLGGYWCNTQTDAKSENIPRNRNFLLSRRIDGTPEDSFTERLIDIVGDVRGQRIILAQILKNKDGTDCKTNCLTAQRVVHKDMLEVGDWNSSTAVFKSNSPREYVHRCDK